MKLCTVYPQEINEGRRVGRAELYCVTHTNKKGKPVDDYSASKIVSHAVQLSLLYLCLLIMPANGFVCEMLGRNTK